MNYPKQFIDVPNLSNLDLQRDKPKRIIQNYLVSKVYNMEYFQIFRFLDVLK